MLIFIHNTPRSYAWGSLDALPEMLGQQPTGAPQAELWLGDHPGSPASIAKGTPREYTLIELIAADPANYGVAGGPLPFLLKVLAIGAPLSLQVHPNLRQAKAGFAAEEREGVPLDAATRNYRDRNHKPEMLVALSPVRVLCGFRDLGQVSRELRALASVVSAGSALSAVADLLSPALNAERCGAAHGSAQVFSRVRSEFFSAVFTPAGGTSALAAAALSEMATALPRVQQQPHSPLAEARVQCLTQLLDSYPGDAGTLVSMLLHLLELATGEAIYLQPQQLHAYLGGIAVEVMAASDNVLRAGLTAKHIDVQEMLRVVDLQEIAPPWIMPAVTAPGVSCWAPGISDFQLFRVRPAAAHPADAEDAELKDPATVQLPAPEPLVLLVTQGKVTVHRDTAGMSEFANVARGQSLYISAGDPINLAGCGEAFVATVGSASGSASGSVSGSASGLVAKA